MLLLIFWQSHTSCIFILFLYRLLSPYANSTFQLMYLGFSLKFIVNSKNPILFHWLSINYFDFLVIPRMFYLIGWTTNVCIVIQTFLLMVVFRFWTLISVIYETKEILQFNYQSLWNGKNLPHKNFTSFAKQCEYFCYILIFTLKRHKNFTDNLTKQN